jgi:AraC-like DNA-binding protein
MRVYSTSDVEKSNAFQYWADLVCDVYVGLELYCCRAERGAFAATISCFDLSSIRVSAIAGSGHRATRTRKKLGQSPSDDVFGHLQVGGRSSVVQCDRRANLAPGDLVFYDASAEYEIATESDFSAVIFQLPRQVVGISAMSTIIGNKLSGEKGLGSPIVRFLSAVPSAVPGLPLAERNTLEQYTIDLLLTAMKIVGAPGLATAKRRRSTAQQSRAQRVIDQRLNDPSFDREALADALGISVRGLSRLFRSLQTSPSDYIRMRRLEQCRCALLAPAGMTVTEIALSNGFNDSSHFSSVFRKEFGMSPSEYRATRSGQSSSRQEEIPAQRPERENWLAQF